MFKEKLSKISKSKFIFKKEKEMKTDCIIYSSDEILKTIDDDSIKQMINVSSLPGIVGNALVMPDMHKGYGFPIGGVAAFDSETGIITPGGIGFDINCGVRVLSTDLSKEEIEEKKELLINRIYDLVPCGVGSESKIVLSDEDLNDVLNEGVSWTVKQGFASTQDQLHCEEQGNMKTADAKFVSPKAKARGRKQLGSLGAGNHFLELQVVQEVFDSKIAKVFGLEEGKVCIMIHCGSRGLGHQVCSDYLRKMEDEYEEVCKNLPEKDLIYAPIKSKLGEEYFKAMSAAANYAWANRQVITNNIRKAFKEIFPESDLKLVYDVAHNIAKIEDHVVGENSEVKKVYVHRKGATRCFPAKRPELPKDYFDIGQPVIVPGSMGTSSYILVGTDDALKESFGSCAHGAGRVLSRFKAKNKFSGEQIKKDLEKDNILLKARSIKGVSDEAPGAYKEIDEVIKTVVDSNLAKMVVKLKPLAVIKG